MARRVAEAVVAGGRRLGGVERCHGFVLVLVLVLVLVGKPGASLAGAGAGATGHVEREGRSWAEASWRMGLGGRRPPGRAGRGRLRGTADGERPGEPGWAHQGRFTPAGHSSPSESAPSRPPAGSSMQLEACVTSGPTRQPTYSVTVGSTDRRLSSSDLAGLPAMTDSPRLGTPAPPNRHLRDPQRGRACSSRPA